MLSSEGNCPVCEEPMFSNTMYAERGSRDPKSLDYIPGPINGMFFCGRDCFMEKLGKFDAFLPNRLN